VTGVLEDGGSVGPDGHLACLGLAARVAMLRLAAAMMIWGARTVKLSRRDSDGSSGPGRMSTDYGDPAVVPLARGGLTGER
jgi:hypothetical protein